MSGKSLFIASIEPKAGSLIVSMGMMQLLKSRIERVAFFRPIVESRDDSDIDFMIKHFNLDQKHEDAYGFEIEDAEELLSNNRYHYLIESLIAKYRSLQERYDFVLIEGLNRDRFNKALEFNINLSIAKNLGSPYISVINGKDKSFSDIKQEILIEISTVKNEHIKHLAIFTNRLSEKRYKKLISKNIKYDTPTFFLPEIAELDMPSVGEIMHSLTCKLILGEKRDLDRIIKQSKIAAMNIEHILGRFEDGDFIIVPGDRLDIILTALSANYSNDFPSIAGILLTGGIEPSQEFLKLISGLSFFNIPIISTDTDTYNSMIRVTKVPAKIRANRERKISLAMGNFMNNIDVELLTQRVMSSVSLITTPEMFEYSLYERASSQIKKIVLPESQDERILRATEILLRRNVVEIILLGDPKEIHHRTTALGLDISKATIIKPCDSPLMKPYVKKLLKMRAHKGLTLDAARDAMQHSTYFATMMVQEGDADGMVSGAIHTTQDTIRPALQIIKTTPDISLVSSLFLMCLETKVLVYADCAVNQDPDAQELAQIAIASAKSATSFGVEPRIAMLSYSTGSSGKGDDVEKVRKATKIVKKLRPDLLVEGPIQYDAAIDPRIAKKKLPDSKVAGQATVYIFPDLNTGNNTYKAVQRSSGAIAIGPILQGLKKPVNDLSRGCEIADIVNTVLITAIQAQGIES
jgi:phosphate acetyltransferase